MASPRRVIFDEKERILFFYSYTKTQAVKLIIVMNVLSKFLCLTYGLHVCIIELRKTALNSCELRRGHINETPYCIDPFSPTTTSRRLAQTSKMHYRCIIIYHEKKIPAK